MVDSIAPLGWDFVGLHEPAWVDLPGGDEIQAISFLPQELRPRLNAYHRLPKTEAACLAERQAQLEELAAWFLSFALSASLQPWIAWLGRLAEQKSRYLAALQQILAERWTDEVRLAAYLRNTARLIDVERKPLFLTRERYLLPERSHFWGDFWMECLDPCHRQETHLHKVWQQLAPRTPYLLWLEDYSSVAHDRWVRYLTHEAQAGTRALVSEGLLVNHKGRLLSCAERQHFLFVVDLDAELYVQRHEPLICHASFTRGQPVLAAGVLQAREGQLTHLKFESGHYLSGPEHWWQAIELLLEKGLRWSTQTRVTVFDRYRFVSKVLTPRSVLAKQSFFSDLGLSSFLPH